MCFCVPSEQLLCMRPSVEQRSIDPITLPPTRTTRTSRPWLSFTYSWNRYGASWRIRWHRSERCCLSRARNTALPVQIQNVTPLKTNSDHAKIYQLCGFTRRKKVPWIALYFSVLILELPKQNVSSATSGSYAICKFKSVIANGLNDDWFLCIAIK